MSRGSSWEERDWKEGWKSLKKERLTCESYGVGVWYEVWNIEVK
jgi:hypothetical protein